MEAAVAAFGEIRNYSSEKIAAFLDEIAEQIEALGDELLDTADRETGLGLPRLTGERARTTGQFRAFASLLRDGSYLRPIINSEQPDQPSIRQMQFPVGPVAIFAASKFSFRLRRCRWRHGLGAGGRLPRGRQGASGSSGHIGDVRGGIQCRYCRSGLSRRDIFYAARQRH